MKIIALLFTILCASSFCVAQPTEFQQKLDSAKILFKQERTLSQVELDTFNYHKIVDLLKKAVEIDSLNAEVHYFLAYAYSRLNSRDGRSMINMSEDLLIKTSAQLEKVIKLSPKYNGALLALDPYTKLTAEWGSMAMSYWHQSKKQEAVESFKQGKLRGGFQDFLIELNKKILKSCKPNAILLASGDIFTFPLWYLQIVENYRPDVSVIDINLLNTQWYPKWLSEKNKVGFNLPSKVLDTLEYQIWKDSTITINNFAWKVKPSYYNKIILRGDRIFLSLLTHNKFKRPIYFTAGFDESKRLSLKPFLKPLVVLDELAPKNPPDTFVNVHTEAIIEILQLNKYLNKNSPDQSNLYDSIRYQILWLINTYIDNNNQTKAKELMNLLNKYANEKVWPYQDSNGLSYLTYLKSKIVKN